MLFILLFKTLSQPNFRQLTLPDTGNSIASSFPAIKATVKLTAVPPELGSDSQARTVPTSP